MLMMVQALAELAVMYPVNGAFFTYIVRFLDPSWYVATMWSVRAFQVTDSFGRGFAMGWDYAIQWLTILPFELTAAGATIKFWRDDINVGVWIAVFLVILSVIQIFGVRGYGEGAS